VHAPGLDGLVLTEHSRRWPHERFSEAAGNGFFLVNAREVETACGHIVVIGVEDEALTATRDVERLRSVVLERGGAMILAHPFRHFPSSWNLLFPQSRDHWSARDLEEWTPDRLAQHPVFGLVDAVETLNSGCTPKQNELAAAVAEVLRMPTVGASDAHDLSFLGWFATEFDDSVRDEASLIAALRAGDCRPLRRTPAGAYEAAAAR
jgi:predicted metal-dependent phosphoesterase TrpH